MSSFGIQFTGLASGIDTRSLIDAIVSARRAPVQRLQGQRQDLVSRQSSVGQLQSLLADLRSAAADVGFGTRASSLGATIPDGAGFRVSLSDQAATGQFDIEVQKLASAQSNSSLGYGSRTAQLGSGTLTIGLGSDSTTLNFTDPTLEDIASAIDDLDGLEATILDTGDSNAPYRLLVQAEETGADRTITFSATGDTTLIDLASDLKNNELTQASDAAILVNNVEIRRPTNTISDLIDGVTISLDSTTTSSSRLRIELDPEATAESVQTFLDAYNAVVDAIRSRSARDDNGNTGPLFGDRTAQSILRGLRDLTGRSITTDAGSTGLLSDFGIDGSLEGRLSLDRSAFEEALNSDTALFDDLLSGDGGLIDSLRTQIDIWRDADGLLDNRQDALDTSIRSLDRRIERGEDRLVLLEQSLSARFAALETLLSQIQGQGLALGGLQAPGSGPGF